MIPTIAIALLFFISLFTQSTVIQAFGLPISATPFHLAIAFLLLHRGRMELGSVWLVLTPLMGLWVGLVPGTWYAYVLLAILGPILVTRIFAKQSFLALIGFSWSLYIIFMIASIPAFAQPVTMTLWGAFMLTITLVGISYIERRLNKFGKRFLVVRSSR